METYHKSAPVYSSTSEGQTFIGNRMIQADHPTSITVGDR